MLEEVATNSDNESLDRNGKRCADRTTYSYKAWRKETYIIVVSLHVGENLRSHKF